MKVGAGRPPKAAGLVQVVGEACLLGRGRIEHAVSEVSKRVDPGGTSNPGRRMAWTGLPLVRVPH